MISKAVFLGDNFLDSELSKRLKHLTNIHASPTMDGVLVKSFFTLLVTRKSKDEHKLELEKASSKYWLKVDKLLAYDHCV